MKKLLLQLDSDEHPSVFDTITAYDAGADQVLAVGDVAVPDVQNLVYGAIFTRGGEDLKNTAIFIGGSDVPTGEAMFEEVMNTFFGPMRVSVMADPNGSNTTAAAAVRKITKEMDVRGKRAVVFAGTGPVGLRACALLAKEGAKVHLTSRSLRRAESASELIRERFDLEVTPHQVTDGQAAREALEGAHILMTTGAPGVQLVEEDIWKASATIEIIADVNAVPPHGVEGIKPHWDGKQKEGKVIFGALGIGGLKMKVHHASVARLFESNELVLGAEEIYDIAKELAQ